MLRELVSRGFAHVSSSLQEPQNAVGATDELCDLTGVVGGVVDTPHHHVLEDDEPIAMAWRHRGTSNVQPLSTHAQRKRAVVDEPACALTLVLVARREHGSQVVLVVDRHER